MRVFSWIEWTFVIILLILIVSFGVTEIIHLTSHPAAPTIVLQPWGVENT